MSATTVIVGAGVAGASAALRLRTGGYQGRVVLIGDEPHPPYRRPPLSKDLLSGKTPEERIRLRPPEVWEQQGIELRTGRRVVALDVESRTLELDDGDELAYDQLLLATGGRARELPHAAAVPGVFTLRTIGDVAALRHRLRPGSSLLVVGAGLIGGEVAATASGLGCSVVLLEAERHPMSRLLPPQLAEPYAELHRRHGVELHTGVQVATFEPANGCVRVTDTTGRQWTADTVLVAVGIAPNTELAARAGIAVDERFGGIVVDEYLRTSAPGVFAAGDVACLPNVHLGGRQRVEHWTNAQEQGTAAAAGMLGERTVFDKVPWCWSDQYGKSLHVAGWPAADDEVTVRGRVEEHEFTAVFRRGGRLVAAVSMNRPKDVRIVRGLITSRPGATVDEVFAALG
ncbi:MULTISPECIES: FAD-dependent oxidoreductase [Thermocrispum]|uniref:FAD-dependent oxidoreductase n=1 Tax=Thermocrispum agreste TaxID=37925 RepID=A0A2W4J8E0_9PSEU|nr:MULTISPECIES: FAD-dependent oxidoreductase [Thermocrispum]PZM95432.1 MAG: FAD-dependent oxidoreductase [Thermocrispum agreste]